MKGCRFDDRGVNLTDTVVGSFSARSRRVQESVERTTETVPDFNCLDQALRPDGVPGNRDIDTGGFDNFSSGATKNNPERMVSVVRAAVRRRIDPSDGQAVKPAAPDRPVQQVLEASRH